MNEQEIRKDYFRDEYVIIAPGRSKRPVSGELETAQTENKICFFCPDNFCNEVITYSDDNPNDDWQIMSTVNKFPAVSFSNPKAYGQAEVIIETRKHGLEMNDFSSDHIVRVLNAYISRYEALRNTPGIKHVIIFKNEGGKAGASIAHSHSQVIALPILPPKIMREIEAYNDYYNQHLACPYCDIIKKEAGSNRVIWEDENLFVLSPYASDAPYGVWLMPKRHVRTISELSHHEKNSIAEAIKIVLAKLEDLNIPFNYFIENAIGYSDYHMYIKLMPRTNIWAGMELGTGVIINPVYPEVAAEFYRS